jgi:hypothetical protein
MNGQFLPGGPGRPGRPRRAYERDYLAALSDAVPMDRWRKIVERAVADAEQGDAKARAWLGIYLAGKPTGDTLRKIAVDALAGVDQLADSVRTAAKLKPTDDEDFDDEDFDDEDLDDGAPEADSE